MTRSLPLRGRVMLLWVAWLAFASLLVMPTGTASALPSPAPAPVVERQGFSCGKATVPLGGLDGWTVNGMSTGSKLNYVLPLAGTSTLTVAAGGAAPAAALSGGTVAMAAAAFLVGFVGTCKAYDWVTGDGMGQTSAPFESPLGIQTGVPYRCSTNAALPSAGSDMCMNLSWDSITPYWDRWSSAGYGQSAPTVNGVTYPGTCLASCNEYYLHVVGTEQGPYAKSILHPNGSAWCLTTQSGSRIFHCPSPTQFPTSGQTTIRLRCYNPGNATTLSGTLGASCGFMPGGMIGMIGDGQFRAFVTPLPHVRQYGWQRRLRSDIECMNVAGQLWRSVKWDGPYWDRELALRISIPSCPDGFYPLQIRIVRIPVNSSDDPFGTNCGSICGTDISQSRQSQLETAPWLIWKQYAPSDWRSVSLRPAWVVCLAAGNECGTPTEVEGECTWGGNVVPAPFCVEEEQITETHPLAPVRDPEAPKTTPRTDTDAPADTRVDPQPIQNPNPDPEPGGRTETEAGAPGVSADFPIEGGSHECWPSGWGWFNPAQWVLRPIQCALRWAFVPAPTAVADRFAALSSMQTRPPLQWVSGAMDFVTGSGVVFADWETAGPECTDVLNTEICPRTWDTSGGLPVWVSTGVVVMFWMLLVIAVVRFF